jgi:signal transduction histidine kinase
LIARGRTVGLLGLEHPAGGHFDERSVLLLRGLADVLALSVDNARWFGRLRTLGAEEERGRIARELHDRLGQWLTYIALELEQISMNNDDPPPELERLRADVQSALDDLRSTLQDLRAGVDAEHPLSDRGPALVQRFAQRSGLSATFTTSPPGDRAPVPIENELLRILQEALTNVERHAGASAVEVTWTVAAGSFELAIRDDGAGFRPEASVRDSAYGLVGMRERADVIGARIRIDSSPGVGTCISVSAGDTDRGVRAPRPDRVDDTRAVSTASSGPPLDTTDEPQGRTT